MKDKGLLVIAGAASVAKKLANSKVVFDGISYAFSSMYTKLKSISLREICLIRKSKTLPFFGFCTSKFIKLTVMEVECSKFPARLLNGLASRMGRFGNSIFL